MQKRILMAAFCLSAGLVTAGCFGGGGDSAGGGLSGILLAGGGSSGGGGGGGGGAGGGGGGVGSIVNPEPSSIALFGGGLAGFALWRRRKSQKRS